VIFELTARSSVGTLAEVRILLTIQNF